MEDPDQDEYHRGAQTYTQVAQGEGDGEGVAQSAGYLDELRGDEDDQHLQRLDEGDGEESLPAFLSEQLRSSGNIVGGLELYERDHYIQKEE